jgi:hypothetical protein
MPLNATRRAWLQRICRMGRCGTATAAAQKGVWCLWIHGDSIVWVGMMLHGLACPQNSYRPLYNPERISITRLLPLGFQRRMTHMDSRPAACQVMRQRNRGENTAGPDRMGHAFT